MRHLTRQQTSKIGTAALDHHKHARWTHKTIQICTEAADHLLGCHNGRKVEGLRSGRPPQEILMSSDYIDEAVSKSEALKDGSRQK